MPALVFWRRRDSNSPTLGVTAGPWFYRTLAKVLLIKPSNLAFKLLLLLFKPHQGIYDGPQPLLSSRQTAAEACSTSDILCPLCMCPTKKVFQHGCDAESCKTAKFAQALGMVTRFVLVVATLAPCVWCMFFSGLSMASPWAAFEFLTATLLGFGYARTSSFLEVQVGDPLPVGTGPIVLWVREKAILDSPDDRFVTACHRARMLCIQTLMFCAFAFSFEAPLGIDTFTVTTGCVTMWSFLVLQYFVY